MYFLKKPLTFVSEIESHQFETEFSVASEKDKKLGRQKYIDMNQDRH